MRIAMIGVGYVGLVSGACLADFGHTVVCVDKDSTKIAALKRGDLPIHEPGLQDLVHTNLLERPCVLPKPSFITAGTPSRQGDGNAEFSNVHDVAREIARALKKFTAVVTKSTVACWHG